MLIFPLLRLDRLILRKLHADDVDVLVSLANNPKISKDIINMAFPFTHAHAAMRLGYVSNGFTNKSHFVFAIIEKMSNNLIGEISVHLDKEKNQGQIGYWIGEPFWNHGYGSEAIGGLVRFCFDVLVLDAIYASVNEENIASTRVLLKNKFEKHSRSGKIVYFILPKE